MGTSIVEWYRVHILRQPPKQPRNGSDNEQFYDPSTDAFYLEMQDVRESAIGKARTHHRLALEESKQRRERGNPIADSAFPPRRYKGDA